MGRCKATTAKGKRCTNKAKQDGLCGIHLPGYKGGRKSQLSDIQYDQVEKLTKLGATDQELADFFGVTEQTINNWKKQDQEFFESLKRGKMLADANVASRLYSRAIGYEHDAVKIMQHNGSEVIVPYTKLYPPDTTAAIFWLKNRQPEKWRDKVEHDVTDETKGQLSDLMQALRGKYESEKQ